MTRDIQAERLLDERGVEYGYCAQFAVADINRDASLKNQARFQPLIDTVVAQYSRAMQDGDEFPAVILNKNGRGFVVISGNHRSEAARKAGRAFIDAYIVQIQDQRVLETLTRSCNALMGQPESEDDRIQHARILIATYGIPISDAAKTMRVSESKLKATIQAARTKERLTRFGVSAEKLSTRQLQSMDSIQNDHVMEAVGRLAVDAAMPAESIDNLRNELKTARTEADQIAIVNKARSQPEIRERIGAHSVGKGIPQLARRTLFIRTLTTLEKLLSQYKTAEGLQMSDATIAKQTLERVNAIATACAQVLSNGKT